MPRKTVKEMQAIQAANNPEPRGTITTLQRIKGQKIKRGPADPPIIRRNSMTPRG